MIYSIDFYELMPCRGKREKIIDVAHILRLDTLSQTSDEPSRPSQYLSARLAFGSLCCERSLQLDKSSLVKSGDDAAVVAGKFRLSDNFNSWTSCT
jgi:hypothetical protein